ncbi:MAG: VRR-NUC domain-containing protein [Clostridia bacterium]
MLEREIVVKIQKYLKETPNVFFFKEHGGQYGTAGIPDLICCYKGKFIAFEVKTDIGKTTVLQQITIKRILKAGGYAVVVRSVEEVKKIIQALS